MWQQTQSHLVHLAAVGIKGDVKEDLQDLHGSLGLLPPQQGQLWAAVESRAGHLVHVGPAEAERGIQSLRQQADTPQLARQLGSHVHAQGGDQKREAQVEEPHLVVPMRLAALLEPLGQSHDQLELCPRLLSRIAVEHDVAQALQGLHDHLQVRDLRRDALTLPEAGVSDQDLHGVAGGEGSQALLVTGQDADGFQAGQLTGRLEVSLQEAQH